jgi:hypothetical protein
MEEIEEIEEIKIERNIRMHVANLWKRNINIGFFLKKRNKIVIYKINLMSYIHVYEYNWFLSKLDFDRNARVQIF